MTPALEVSGLSKRFGSVAALSDATFRIAAGEVVAVLGPSGSGKRRPDRQLHLPFGVPVLRKEAGYVPRRVARPNW